MAEYTTTTWFGAEKGLLQRLARCVVEARRLTWSSCVARRVHSCGDET